VHEKFHAEISAAKFAKSLPPMPKVDSVLLRMACFLKYFVGDENSDNAEAMIPRNKYICIVKLTSMAKVT